MTFTGIFRGLRGKSTGNQSSPNHLPNPPFEQSEPWQYTAKKFLATCSVFVIFFVLLHFSSVTGYTVTNQTNSTNMTVPAENTTVYTNSTDIFTNITINITQNIEQNITQNLTGNLTGNDTMFNDTAYNTNTTDNLADQNITLNITANTSKNITSPNISIKIISPADFEAVSAHVNFTFSLDSTEGIDRCGIYFLYKYIQDEFWLGTEKTSLSEGTNRFEIKDFQPGEYLWKIGCSNVAGRVFSEENTFFSGVSNLTGKLFNITNMTVNLSEIASVQSEIIQGKATVDEPVNWTRRILVNRTGDLIVRTFIPKSASGIEIFEEPLTASTDDRADGTTLFAAAGIKRQVGGERAKIGTPIRLIIEEDRATIQRIHSPVAMATYTQFPERQSVSVHLLKWLFSLLGITGSATLDAHPIELLTPSDNESGGRNFNLLYQTDREFDACYLYLDSVLSQTDILVLEGINFFEIRDIDAGNHPWQVVCELDHDRLYSEVRSFKSADFFEEPAQDNLLVEEEQLNLSAANSLFALPEVSGDFLEVNITDNMTSPKMFEIRYTTPGPEKEETQHGIYMKTVTIGSDIRFNNITARTDIPWVPEWLVKLDWKVDDLLVTPVDDIILLDLNNDSLIDMIEWMVPHLSIQEYIVDLSYDIEQEDVIGEGNEGITAEDGEFINIDPEGHLEFSFNKTLSENDTISVYAWADAPGEIILVDSGTNSTLSRLSSVGQEWTWYNLTISEGINISGYPNTDSDINPNINVNHSSFSLFSDSRMMYDYITSYDKMLMIPKKIVSLGVNTSAVLVENNSVDATEIRFFGSKEVILKDGLGRKAASFDVYFENAEADIDLSSINVETSSAEMKTVMHSASGNPLISREKTLYIPSSGEGLVYVCPGAASLDDVNETCPGRQYVYPGVNSLKISDTETLTVTMSEFDENGVSYYKVEGLTGTGGGEAIRIINTHTYPSLGDNWTVMFTSKGEGDLRISPITNTTWSEFFADLNSTEDDLKFVDILCGDQSVKGYATLIGDDNSSYKYSDISENNSIKIREILISNYSCAGTGFLTNTELTGGHHYLLFTFGDQYAVAENYVSEISCNITASCDYTDVFHISSLFNAHAELSSQSNYGYDVCCREVYGELVGTDCGADDAEPILHLESVTNSHVEKVSEATYANELCLSGTVNYNITCAYDTDCGAYETCVASISSTETGSDTNLQVGNCTGTGSYDTKICCDTEVESDCVTPYDDYTVTQDVTFCGGNYLINDSAGDGLIKFGADDITVTCNSTILFGNNSGYGFFLNSRDNITLENCVINNFTQGIYLNSTFGSEFRNNSLFNNTDGVYLKDSMDNIFYDNNFTDNTNYHAYSDIYNNHFNTTTGGEAHGNWWDDVQDMNIYDTNLDGFGDFGSEYPYNSTFTGKINLNVTDWGPYTDKNCADDDGDGYGAEGSNLSVCTYPAYADCNDNNASVIPPRDDLNLTADTWLCDGTYYLNDTENNGLINFKNDNIKLTGNSTIIVGNNTGFAFTAINRVNITIKECDASNYSRGIFMDNTVDSVFRNNTIYNSTYAIYLTGSTGNTIYHNEFVDSSTLHAYSDRIDNYFNKTASGTAEGNLWGGINLLKIYDTQGDGFGDAGLAYPYSSAKGGLVNINVTDWGPITTRNDYQIQPPIPFQPSAGDFITDSRNPVYGWTNPEHTLSDSVTYNIQVDDNSDFSSPELVDTGISEIAVNTYYWNSSWLQLNTEYFWRVRANDTYNLSSWSVSYNFTIMATTSCTQPTDEMDFGQMCIFEDQAKCDARGLGSHINDTLDNHPPPYLFDNDGNLMTRGKTYSTSLWETDSKGAMPFRYYQYMLEDNKSGSYDWALDSDWVNMTIDTGSALEAFYGFKWQNVSDAINLHIRLESPTDEPPGVKYSTTYIECEQNETY